MITELDQFQYILLLTACLLITLPLEFLFAARVYRRPLRLLQVIFCIALVFSVWDIIAINAGLWTYSERFTSGVMLPFNLPLEELLFFIAIPVCGVLTYEAVGTVLRFIGARMRSSRSLQLEVEDA